MRASEFERWIGFSTVAVGMYAASTLAQATVSVQLQTTDGLGPLVTASSSANTEVEREIVDGLSNAYGYSNLVTGVSKSRTFASAPGLANVATASMTDIISFTSGYGGTAYLDWYFAGATDPGLVYQNGAVLQLNVTGNGVLNYELHALLSSGACTAIYTTCSVGSSVVRTGSMPITIRTGDYSIQTALTTTSFAGEVDFSNTVHLYLRLPAGAGFTSQSGQFLSAAPPISVVPEPSTITLLAFGIGSLFACGRRRFK